MLFKPLLQMKQLEQQLSRFHIIEENDKRLFECVCLESIFHGHSHHLLIYSNNKVNSLKLIQYKNAVR